MKVEFNENTWRISDFTNIMNERMKITLNDPRYSPHMNTVDRWFVDMENAGIHYVNRVGKKRAYQQEDLEIACFIAEMRDKHKLLLQDIYLMVGEKFDVREFPDDTPAEQQAAFNREELEGMIKRIVEESVEGRLGLEISKKISDEVSRKVQGALPAPVDAEQVEEENISRIVVIMESNLTLEEEAIAEWKKKPREERKLKGFWGLSKEDDMVKRDAYIRNYKKKHVREVVELKYKQKEESPL